MVQPALFVGCREADPQRRHIPGSQPRPCAKCGSDTFFSQATLNRPEASHPLTRFECIDCADLEGLLIQPPTQAQRTELAAAGHDPESWPLSEAWGKVVTLRDGD